MKLFSKFILAFCICISSLQINSQNKTKDLSLDQGTIKSQFEYILNKSGNFRGTNGLPYEAVKQVDLLKLKTNVIDSLKNTYKALSNSKATVAEQHQEIKALKTKLGDTKQTLDLTNEEKDNMTFLGLQTSKSNYNVIMWLIIAALTGLLLFFIYKFKNSNVLTKQAQLKLDEVELEFEDHRRTALEREQKVRRQLQDEINKNRN